MIIFWQGRNAELKSLLPADEYSEARASTLNAFYTSPTVIKAMYEALSNMGLSKGNVLEPSCGVGNFMGLVPESMENIKMYGVELDNVSGRIAQQLYAKVARAIKTVFYALDVVNQGMQEKQSITVRCMDIEDLEKQAEAIRVEQIKLYESYADGVLLRDAYIEKKKALSEKLAALQDSIRTEKEEQECADELDEEIRALTKQASEKTYIGGLTKECVDAFVSMVYLYDDQTMKIEFNCEDVIRRALEKYGA